MYVHDGISRTMYTVTVCGVLFAGGGPNSQLFDPHPTVG